MPETAELLAVSEKTVRRLIVAGRLRAARVGRQLRIPAEAIRELTDGGR